MQELCQTLGRAADPGAEAMVAAAAKRAGEVGTAGRGSVLSGQADRTLGAVVASLSEPKVWSRVPMSFHTILIYCHVLFPSCMTMWQIDLVRFSAGAV